MKFRVDKFDINDGRQLESLVKWDCDKEMFHLVTPVQEKYESIEYPDAEGVLKKYEDPSFASGVYVIFDGERPIGNLSIQIDPPQVLKKVQGTSWLGLVIGEKEYWGTDAASMAMTFFESESQALGLNRVELGTFEFNIRAQKFYRKLGYQEIGRLKDFTYFDGRFWDDIRMEKMLNRSHL